MDASFMIEAGQVAGQVASFVWTHWASIGEILLVLLPAIALALRAREWNKLLVSAGRLTYLAAGLAELDNPARRAWVAKRLRETLPAWMLPLFSNASIEAAIEYGLHRLAKPQLKADGST